VLAALTAVSLGYNVNPSTRLAPVHLVSARTQLLSARAQLNLGGTYDGAERLTVGALLALLGSTRVAAVYEVIDPAGLAAYVGISRNVVLSLNAHVAKMPERVATVRLVTFREVDRHAMDALKKQWIAELGYTPIGNGGEEAERWAASLREAADSPPPVGEPLPASAGGTVASPFAQNSLFGVTGGAALELTAANVDAALEEVRPYLIADGGNVKVVSVDMETRSVQLSLQGACGSCASSTVTMKQGIEKTLRSKFADLGEVVDVGQADPEAAPLSVDLVYQKLEALMPAITALGGSIRVVSAADSEVELEYNGPAKIKFGIELALKDVPQIEKIVFT